ncbi:uncharacterized protein LOC135390990 isoform X2 [Ornithodoros turicata]|uniref:uncharacterized protein LOC135390990 isoform X2 n=1 Tax=Ornithodoros turicata TaxID=34597 RepID=UPI00313A0296
MLTSQRLHDCTAGGLLSRDIFVAVALPLEKHFFPETVSEMFSRERTEDTFEVIPVDYQSISVKRRRIDGYDSQDRMTAAARTFLTVRHNSYVFHTEEWKPRGCSMYLPLTQDVMLNMRHIEQVSFENDQFFLADGKGNYAGAKTGNAIHLWRLDPNTRKLYVSRSLLFLREQDYREVQLQLASL